jgi:hypothetical protein
MPAMTSNVSAMIAIRAGVDMRQGPCIRISCEIFDQFTTQQSAPVLNLALQART